MSVKLLIRALIRMIVGFLVMGALMFIPAWSFNYWQAWLLLGILFIPMQYPEDVEAAKQIASRMKQPSTLLDEEYTTSELLSIVGNLELLISIRLHALIFAGVMNVPMVGISYDPKIDRFLDSVGQKPAADLQTVTADNLMEDVRAKWELRGGIREKNAELLSELRRLAFRNAELALELVKKQK